MFLVEVKQAGIFEIRNPPDRADGPDHGHRLPADRLPLPAQQRRRRDPAQRLPAVHLSEINFQAMYEQRQRRPAAPPVSSRPRRGAPQTMRIAIAAPAPGDRAGRQCQPGCHRRPPCQPVGARSGAGGRLCAGDAAQRYLPGIALPDALESGVGRRTRTAGLAALCASGRPAGAGDAVAALRVSLARPRRCPIPWPGCAKGFGPPMPPAGRQSAAWCSARSPGPPADRRAERAELRAGRSPGVNPAAGRSQRPCHRARATGRAFHGPACGSMPAPT